jgi:competence protein ComEC
MIVAGGTARDRVVVALLPGNHLSKFPYYDERVVIEGEAITEPEIARTEKKRMVVEADRITCQTGTFHVTGKLLVTLKGVSRPPEYGDRLEVRGILRRPSPARNPGAFDYLEYLRRSGIYATLVVRQPDRLRVIEKAEGKGITAWLVLPVRRAIKEAIERNLTGGTGALVKGIVLGERQELPEDVASAFNIAGVVHVLAVSGGNVGFVALIFLGLFKVIPVPRPLGVVATLFAIALYAAVTGLTPSVVRASVMAGVLLIGETTERRADPINSLGVAGLLMLALRPEDLFDPGFQLSFAATLSIVALYRPIIASLPDALRQENHPWGKWVTAPLAVSLAAQIGTAPITVYHFGRLSIIGLVANLLVVPATGLSMTLGVITAMFGFWASPVATLVNGCNWVILRLTIEVTKFFASAPWASLDLARPSFFFLIAYTIATLALTGVHRSIAAKKILIVTLLVTLNVGLWRSILFKHNDRLEVVFLDVGQGDGIVIRCPNGRTILIDGGLRTPEYDAGESVLLPFLRFKGVKKVDVVVASHPHNDHIGGLITLLDHVSVGHFLDGGQGYRSETADLLSELVKRKGIHYHRVEAGDSLVGLGGVEGVILHPTPFFVSSDGEGPDGLNNGSVVLRLEYAGRTLLLPGDAERETDPTLLMWGERLRATILKVAHHGSQTSSTPAFLDAVRPEVAVVSVGRGNTFGHPAPEVVERYQKRDIRLYRTDQNGAVTVVITKDRMRVSTMIHE